MSTDTTLFPGYSKLQIRIAVSVFFFCQGICFASWASRIPDIKTALHLSEAALGTILLGLPIGQFVTMPFSGRAVTRFGSKNVLRIAIVFYCLALISIGLVTAPWQLVLCLFAFGVSGNMCNISVNTQGVNAEALYGRAIMSSFHGVWSTAGFTGALTGLLMMKLQLSPFQHFCIVASIVILLSQFFAKYLLLTPTSKAAASFKRISMPHGLLLQLGIIGFCCLSCEGCMFDWSGVYFKDVVKAEGSMVSLGYASFMIMMATGRFVGDKLAEKFSRKKMVQVSGVLIFSGMMFAVLLPYLITATIGFLVVGFGVSTIIPLLYSTVGKANLEVSKGIAIATVSSIGFLGFLMGPPLIGYIAQLAGLQYSFMTIAFLGLGISVLISKVKEIE
ncbi:MAG: MFS transporter [Ferruginibacter sp.]|nr:MFS transporter [Ferruginibacter sp.]